MGVKITPFWGSDRHQENKLYTHKIKNVQKKGVPPLLGDFWQFCPFRGQTQCILVAAIGMQVIEEN